MCCWNSIFRMIRPRHSSFIQVANDIPAMTFVSDVPVANRLVNDDVQIIDIPSVEVHDVETEQGGRAKCLKHLIKKNHANYSVLYHQLQFDNHTPHILSSAYLLGATEQQLHRLYEVESRGMAPWRDPPAEVTDRNWRDLLGQKEYQKGYLDYFEHLLASEFSHDWEKVVEHVMFKGEKPLISGVIGGRTSPSAAMAVISRTLHHFLNVSSWTPSHPPGICLRDELQGYRHGSRYPYRRTIQLPP